MLLELFFNIQKQGYFRDSCFKEWGTPIFSKVEPGPKEARFKEKNNSLTLHKSQCIRNNPLVTQTISQNIYNLQKFATINTFILIFLYSFGKVKVYTIPPWVVMVILNICQVYGLHKHKYTVSRGEHAAH